MTKNQFTIANTSACALFDQNLPFGFALPFFSNSESAQTLFVQVIDERTNLVKAFSKLDDLPPPLLITSHTLTSTIGEPPVYAFVDKSGHISIGQLDKIKDALISFAEKFPDLPEINLQIYELVGTLSERRRARVLMWEKIRADIGTRPALAFYRGSILRPILWDHLVKGATDEFAASRILAARGSIDCKSDEYGRISLDLRDLDPADYAQANLEEIKRSLEIELQQIDTTNISHNDSQSQDRAAETELVDDAMASILRAMRQEERVAIALRVILADRQAGLEVLEKYSNDRAQDAREILWDLKSKLTQEKSSTTETSDVGIVWLALEKYLSGMPESRAYAFLYFSRYLSYNLEVRRFLRYRFSGLKSQSYERHRKEIEFLLGQD